MSGPWKERTPIAYVLVLLAIIAMIIALGAWAIFGGSERLVIAGCSAVITVGIYLGRHMGFLR